MFRILAFIACLLTSPAWAFLPGQPVGMLNPQVLPANAIAGLPAVGDDLSAAGYPIAGGICSEYGHQVPCNLHYSTTRASTKYVSALSGLYASVPINTLGMGSNNGALIEESRTNDALWARDMTNAAWVKTTMTTAFNAVGIDDGANSATTLTATGALAMAVQTITLGSQADNYSVFLKRVTGSGTINLCLAATACGAATPCVVTSTTTFTRCTVTATVLNPIVGIQIATNGDAVIADFNQMEPGGFPTSPILTTTVAVTRSADAIVTAGALTISINALERTAGFVLGVLPASGVWATNFNNANLTNYLGRFSSATVVNIRSANIDTAATYGSGSLTTTISKVWGSWGAAGNSVVANNGTVGTSANLMVPSTNIAIGSEQGVGFINGYMLRFSTYNSREPDTLIKALTQ